MPEDIERGMPYEKPGPPKGEAYGIASITQALEGTEFPTTKQDLLRKAGNQSIHWTKGSLVSLRDILEEAPEEEFPSMAQVVSAVSDVMDRREGKRQAA